MTQEELVTKYIEIDPASQILYTRPSDHFKSILKAYGPLQQGTASEINFFDYTAVMFTETDKPEREPDFVSGSGSTYWYTDEGVIRMSDHWGNHVANCDWAIRLKSGKTEYGYSSWSSRSYTRELYGFARWSDFIQKARLFEKDGKQFVTTFENTKGRELFEIDGRLFERVLVENWISPEQ